MLGLRYGQWVRANYIAPIPRRLSYESANVLLVEKICCAAGVQARIESLWEAGMKTLSSLSVSQKERG